MPPFPIEWRFDSSHALNHANIVEYPPQLERPSQRALIRSVPIFPFASIIAFPEI